MASSPRTISATELFDRPCTGWFYRRSLYAIATLVILTLDWYTIRAVDQDTFEDVPMPPPPPLLVQYPGVTHKGLDDSLEGVKKKGSTA